MFKKTLAAALVLGLASTGAQAADWDVSGYIQGNLGQSRAEKPRAVKDFQREVSAPGVRTSTDKTDTAYKLIVGLQLNPYVALEAQYTDLGKFEYKASASNGAEYVRAKTDFDTAGYGANLVGTLPIDKFTLFAKTGLHNLKTKAKLRAVSTVVGESFDIRESKNVTKWTQSYGIGASYEFIDNLAVVVEAERYRNVADKKWDGAKIKHNVDLFSAGIRYKF